MIRLLVRTVCVEFMFALVDGLRVFTCGFVGHVRCDVWVCGGAAAIQLWWEAVPRCGGRPSQAVVGAFSATRPLPRRWKAVR